MTDEIIKKCEAAGFRRWTAYGRDRLYINLYFLGFRVEYYKTGHVSYAEYNGEKISNSSAAKYIASKPYIDVLTGRVHCSDSFIKGLVEDLFKRIKEA